MNPKVKLLVLILVSSAMLVFPNFIFIITTTIIASVLIFLNRIHRKFTVWIKPLFLIFLLIILLQSFTFGGLGFSMTGLYFGTLFSLRIVALLTMVFVFVQTTTMGKLAQAFDFLPGSISQILVLALALVPNIAGLTEKIVNAQKSRGLNFRSPNIFKTYFPILVPLFAKTLDRSEHMALAMEARGFEGE